VKQPRLDDPVRRKLRRRTVVTPSLSVAGAGNFVVQEKDQYDRKEFRPAGQVGHSDVGVIKLFFLVDDGRTK
jgi:hypothetical protein